VTTSTSVPATGPRDRSRPLLARSTAAAKCVVCRTRAVFTGRACSACVNGLVQLLAELGGYWHLLPALVEYRRGNSGRLSPGYESRPPLRVDVLAFLQRATMAPVEDDDVRSLPYALDSLADAVAEEREEQRPAGPALWYLHDQLPWCGRNLDDFALLARDLTELHRQAQALAHDRPGVLGRCLEVGCGGTVFEGARGEVAHCRACKRPYAGLDLARLGASEAAAS
jgi:hypothetical protein